MYKYPVRPELWYCPHSPSFRQISTVYYIAPNTMGIMHYRIDPLPGASWLLRYFENGYNKFIEQLRVKINFELVSGKIYSSTSTNVVLIFTQPKKDGKSARFLIDVVERHKNIRYIIIEIPFTNCLIDWVYSKKFWVIVDLIDVYFHIRVHSDYKQYTPFSCPEGIINTRVMQ